MSEPGKIAKAFAVNEAGQPVAQTPAQVDVSTRRAGYRPISEETAKGLQKASEDKKYVDENWGTAGQVAMGAADGATLGLGPALATKLGILDQGHLEAAGQSGAYTAGEVAGFLAPALLSGGSAAGESAIGKALAATPAAMVGRVGGLAESAVARLLPEAGLMGKAAASSLRMAARGATEGALMNVAHEASHDIIINKPLSAQALLATAVDGALFGGLAGGVLGGVGSLAGSGVDALSNRTMASVAGKGERAGGVALSRIGLNPADYAGRVEGAVGEISDLMKKGETSFAAPTSHIRASMEKQVLEQAAVAKSALEDLARTAQPGVAPLRNLIGALEEENAILYRNTAASTEADSIYKRLRRDLEGKPTAAVKASAPPKPFVPRKTTGNAGADRAIVEENAVGHAAYQEALAKHEASAATAAVPAAPGGAMTTWEQWATSRKVLTARAEAAAEGSLKKTIYESALQKFDAEFSAVGVKTDEAAWAKYAAANAQKAIAESVVEGTGVRMGKEASRGNPLSLNQTDGGAVAIATLMGDPLSGLGIVAARKISAYAQQKLEPMIAEYAARSAIGAKAGAATANVGDRISGALRSFLGAGARGAQDYRATTKASTPTAPKLSYTMKAYEEAMDTADKLTSAAHQARVKEYLAELTLAGHPELAKEYGMAYGRAVADITQNRPKGSLRDKSAGSLGKLPKALQPDDRSMKFMRRLHSMRDPVGTIVNGLEQGNLSRDAVAAIKYVMPDLHNELVVRASQELLTMRQEGRFLPADKVALLGVALDHPVDSKLQKGFIDEVQQGLAANKKPAPSGGSGPPPVTDISAYQTPLQSTV